ncbi:spore coat protein [Bacillus canaveralius]|uniref:spore coat protein n=1 Tax=Bacillus canaveralius TaxID=1403243 RepID=UPI000F7B5990|nr:spore coat protein [Bacillus canaveralius]RSK52950.1 spore coat protein [Bacillus canaveralius]
MREIRRLAWHETLEVHELVAYQAIVLNRIKKLYRKVDDDELKQLYTVSIKALEKNLRELLKFYPAAPGFREEEERAETGFYAGDLLGAAKNAVRNYAIAITETATPALREVLVKQLNAAIDWHAQVFYYMYKRSYYPAYNLQKLLMNDIKLAENAINKGY